MPVFTKMSSCLVLVLTGILVLGQIYTNLGEKSKLKEKDHNIIIQLLKTSNTSSNSTTKNDLKTQIQSKEVYEFYPKLVNIDIQNVLKAMTNNSTDDKMDKEERYCVVRVDENNEIKYYPGTILQVRNQGKNVIDLLCEGDLDPTGDKALSRGALASLAGYG